VLLTICESILLINDASMPTSVNMASSNSLGTTGREACFVPEQLNRQMNRKRNEYFMAAAFHEVMRFAMLPQGFANFHLLK